MKAWDYYEKEITGMEPFHKEDFDKGATIERKAKASDELVILKKLVRYKEQADAADANPEGVARGLPNPEADENVRAEKKLEHSSVVLPVP